MSQINHQDAIVTARDTLFGDENDETRAGAALAVGQDEIDELLYGESLSRNERLARLQQLRDQMITAQAADLSDSDAAGMLGEIERAIAELDAVGGEGMDPASVDHNPEDHRETLSPDDDMLLDLMAEDGADEADVFAETRQPLDATEWEEDDGFDSDKGVR